MRNVSAVLLGLMLAAGCGPSGPTARVNFSEVVEPKTPLSEQYMRIAVMNAQMEGDTGEYDQDKWSAMTADLIQHYLEQAAERHNMPIKLVDREHLKLTMGEKDLAAAGVTDSDESLASAQVKGASAILTTKVSIKIQKDVGKQRSIDAMSLVGGGWSQGGWGGGSVDTTEVDEEARNITVTCQFQLKDAATNELVISHNGRPTQDYSKTSSSFFFGSSQTEADMTPRDQVIGNMIDRHAQDFLCKFVPMEVFCEVQVEPSSNEESIAGARILVTAERNEDYEQALASFKQAIAADADDDDSLFGAGVCCEKLRRFDEARKYYKLAQSLEPKETHYGEAVERLSRSSKRQ